MGKFQSKYIYAALTILLLFLTSCSNFLAGMGGGFISGAFCDPRYKEGEKGPFFRDVKIPENSQKAVIILYQPFYEICGDNRYQKVGIDFSMESAKITDNMPRDYFTVLLIRPQKLRFSAVRKTKTSYSRDTTTREMGEWEITPEAGKRYFVRWSTLMKYISPGWNFKRLNEFQLVDEKTARKELKGSIYLAPRIYKAPVFDKKTGESL